MNFLKTGHLVGASVKGGEAHFREEGDDGIEGDCMVRKFYFRY